MDSPANVWAFIVPGDEIALHNPDLLRLLKQTEQSWEAFVSYGTSELIYHINREGIDEWDQSVGEHKIDNFEPAFITEITHEVMEGLDIGYDESGGENLYEKQFGIVHSALVCLMRVLYKYLPLMFFEPRAHHGVPYELNLLRCLGYDMVFTIRYLAEQTVTTWLLPSGTSSNKNDMTLR